MCRQAKMHPEAASISWTLSCNRFGLLQRSILVISRPCFQRCFKEYKVARSDWDFEIKPLQPFHRRGLACVGATVLGSFVVTGVIFAIGGI